MTRVSKSGTYPAVSECLGLVVTCMNKPSIENWGPGFQGSLTPGKGGGLQCALECGTTLAADNSYRSPPAALGCMSSVMKGLGFRLNEGHYGTDDIPLVIVLPERGCSECNMATRIATGVMLEHFGEVL